MNQDNVLNSLPPFFIGQRVLRIEDGNGVVNGKEYVVAEIGWCCTKWGWRINVVGVPPRIAECGGCNTSSRLNFAAKNFVPIEENFASISYSMVMEEEGKLVSSN